MKMMKYEYFNKVASPRTSMSIENKNKKYDAIPLVQQKIPFIVLF